MLTHINTYVIIPNKSTEISVKKRFCAVLFPAKIYRPATHPIHFAADLPDKIISALRRRYFSFMGNAPSKFHEPTGRDIDFFVNAAAKQGQEFRSEQTVPPSHEQSPATYCLRLNNLETITQKRF